MKTPTPIDFVRTTLALTLALALWSPLQLRAAEPSPAPGGMEMSGSRPEQRQAMMERRHAMMAEMKAQDAELTALVAKLKTAPSDQKLDLLTTIVTRLVEQRAAMNARMESMPGGMMSRRPMDDESKSSHPMMPGMDEKPGDVPAEKK